VSSFVFPKTQNGGGCFAVTIASSRIAIASLLQGFSVPEALKERDGNYTSFF